MTPRTPRRAKVKPLDKVFLSNKEAIAYLGVSDSTLKRWRADRTIGFHKIGSNIWYEKNDLDKLIKSHRQ